MWSFHDDFRRSIKVLSSILEGENTDMSLLSRELGKLFFVVLPIIFREEQIVYPVALNAIPEDNWADMMEQSVDIGWCYIKPPASGKSIKEKVVAGELVDLKTGLLSAEQITLLINNLPVDITFVDENDEVVFFSSGRHRIFPRSKAIIGRKVQNCHPPDSVHIVNEIVDSFKKGIKNEAEFWINKKGNFIHIRYFVLRNEQNKYKGVIEVSQDVTSIRSLEGERRLLDW
jgi:PAS domain S-box-containing protein